MFLLAAVIASVAVAIPASAISGAGYLRTHNGHNYAAWVPAPLVNRDQFYQKSIGIYMHINFNGGTYDGYPTGTIVINNGSNQCMDDDSSSRSYTWVNACSGVSGDVWAFVENSSNGSWSIINRYDSETSGKKEWLASDNTLNDRERLQPTNVSGFFYDWDFAAS